MHKAMLNDDGMISKYYRKLSTDYLNQAKQCQTCSTASKATTSCFTHLLYSQTVQICHILCALHCETPHLFTCLRYFVVHCPTM
jgi:hypothetical protein